MHLFVVRSLQQDPTVLGAHGKCVGSLKIWDKSNQVRPLFVYWPLRLLCCWIESLSYPQQGLFVLAVFHFCGWQVDDGPLHAVPLAAVQVDVGPAHHNVTLYPATGVRFQEVQITFLGHDRARNEHIMNLRANEMRLFLESAASHEADRLRDRHCFSDLTRISCMSGTNVYPLRALFLSTGLNGSRSGVEAPEVGSVSL